MLYEVITKINDTFERSESGYVNKEVLITLATLGKELEGESILALGYLLMND